jgi:hypothetical protein
VKRVAKIGSLAEAKRIGDVVDRHLRVAQILNRHFRPQLSEDLPERRSFLAQFPAQRPFGSVEVCSDVQFRAPNPEPAVSGYGFNPLGSRGFRVFRVNEGNHGSGRVRDPSLPRRAAFVRENVQAMHSR